MTTTPHAESRLLYIDWLRGLAVLCMFEAHVYLAWLKPAELRTTAFHWANVAAGYAAPLFLFLAGIGMALALHGGLARGTSLAAARRTAIKRGFQILIAAFVFRVQEHVLGGGPVSNLFKVDILNCIGVSMMLAAAIGWPTDEEKPAYRALAAALIVTLLSPLVGKLPYSPRFWPLLAYVADGRDWYFPLFPWAAYTFFGLFAGTVWSRATRAGRMPRAMLVTVAIAVAVIVLSWLVLGRPAPRYLFFGGKWRSLPTYVLTHVAWIGILAAVAFSLQRFGTSRSFGPVRQLGRTSLMMYWIHIDIVYGHLAGPDLLNLAGQLGFGQATVGLALLTCAMLPLSWARTRYFGAFRAAVIFERLWGELVRYARDSYRKSVGPRPSGSGSAAAAGGERGE
ncbi:MAG TPA: heparan-alpha-glucosaminide N-acetyltransferase domain-containing protein [Polyangia bacterium]